MNDEANSAVEREQALVELYMDLTGASEAIARNVFMHLCCNENRAAEATNGMTGLNGASRDSLSEKWIGIEGELRRPAMSLAPA